MGKEPNAKFDPERFFVFTSSRVPLVPREPDDYVIPYTSELRGYADPDDDDPTMLVARAKWLLLAANAVADDEDEDLEWVSDAHSQELTDVCGALKFGAIGESFFEGWGDLLYFEDVEVESGFDGRVVAVELIDHILRFHSSGTAGAAFVMGKRGPRALRTAFKNRGFERVPGTRSWELLALDSSRRRPPLPALDGTDKVRSLKKR